MAKKGPKFYVVWKGRNTGIYDNWEDCKNQVFGFEGAQYKSFASRDEALKAFETGPNAANYGKAAKSPIIKSSNSNIVQNSISVDAACSGNPGLMEYRGVITSDKRQIFHQGPFKDGTNNIGEFLALVHVLALLKKQEREDVLIYTDSRTAMAWVKNKKAKTTLDRTGRNDEIFELVARAEKWLQNNTPKNPIVKWETESWGEIPADFGRK